MSNRSGHNFKPATRYVDGLILRDVAGDEQGDLDETFGDDGVATGLIMDTGYVKQVQVQDDGRMIVLDEYFTLARFNADGSLDTSFGDWTGVDRTGYTLLSMSGYGLSPAGVAVLDDGKLLAGGTVWNESTGDCWLLLVRYNTNGTFDTSFDEDGFQFISLDLPTGDLEVATVMAMDADGTVALGGWAYDLTNNEEDLLLVKLSPNQGQTAYALDCGFGTGGFVRQRFGSTQYQEITDIAIDAAGRIVAGATLDSKFWCGRFLADGDLDETFGDVSGQTRTGWTTVDFGFGTETLRALDLTRDGKIVLAGQRNAPLLARLLPDGTLDTSFHQDGKLTVSAGVSVEINDLLVEPDGRIVLGGLSVPGPGINFCLMIGRLNADGTTDTGFGVSGWRQVDTDATEWADERVLALARQADGKIIAAGYTQAGELTLARLSGMTRHYAMQDANWTITGIINPETGQAVERYVFTPYGGRTVLDSAFESRSTSSFGWIVGHQGLAVDVETGLVHNRARYLDTSMGRFTIRDLIGYADGMSLYQYVRSRPSIIADPSGTISVVTNNRDIRSAYAKAAQSTIGSRLFADIDTMAGCLEVDVIINIVSKSSYGSSAPDNPAKLYWDMGAAGPVARKPTRDTFVIEINPLAKVLPTHATTPTEYGLASGTTLEQLIIHEAGHMRQHLFMRLGYYGYPHNWSGKADYPGQYEGVTAEAEYNAVSTENEYLQEIGGDVRIGHGLPSDMQGAEKELVDNLRGEQFMIGVHLLDWPVFPKDEADRLRGTTKRNIGAWYGWLNYFQGGPAKFDTYLRQAK